MIKSVGTKRKKPERNNRHNTAEKKGGKGMFRKTVSMITALVMLFALAPGTGETAESADGMNRITFYWDGNGTDYGKCDMWIWFPDADGKGYLFHPCGYGAKVVLNVPEEISRVGFIVRTEKESRNVEVDIERLLMDRLGEYSKKEEKK